MYALSLLVCSVGITSRQIQELFVDQISSEIFIQNISLDLQSWLEIRSKIQPQRNHLVALQSRHLVGYLSGALIVQTHEAQPVPDAVRSTHNERIQLRVKGGCHL